MLRRDLGFVPGRGKASGSDTWIDTKGRTCRLVLRHKDVALSVIYSLSLELQVKGVVQHRDFIQLLRNN